MKRLYSLLALILCSMIVMNVMVLYAIQTRPTTEQVQKMVEDQNQAAITEEVATRVQKVASEMPSGPKGDTGDRGPIGQKGENGKDGQSITGPKGDPGLKGEPGTPGREIELRRDPKTGDLYMRYTGDTLWSLVEAP